MDIHEQMHTSKSGGSPLVSPRSSWNGFQPIVHYGKTGSIIMRFHLSLFSTKQTPLNYSPRSVSSFSCLLLKETVRLEIIPRACAHEGNRVWFPYHTNKLYLETLLSLLGQHCNGKEALFFVSCLSETSPRCSGEPELLRKGSQPKSKGIYARARPKEFREDTLCRIT